ncbi:MAG: hypothetical protein JNK09_04095 [Prolixibacteraceae bacterium]|nr:hypothetical protein [Prolixibacteraceae bacterium]
MNESYKQFVDKLNSYIRKFYQYQLIRGFILFILLVLVYYSLISMLEYFNYFDPKVKLPIFITTVLLTLVVFVYFLFIPFIKLLGIGKRLSYYDVSSHLQQIYPEIRDRLINVIELAESHDSNYSSELQMASIDQKISELKVFQFNDAIRFKDLKLVFSLLIGIILLFLVLFTVSPELYTESTVRLIHFQQQFEKPAPYTFKLLNDDLEIVIGESVDLKLQCEGKEIPEIMYVDISGNLFLMKKEGEIFSYRIENVNSSLNLFFSDKKYVSDIYKIKVINKPFISSFKVEVIPPAYTNLNKEVFQNIGDLKVVSGTTVKWIFNTVDTDSLFLFFSDSILLVANRADDNFEVSKTILKDAEYSVSIKNSRLKSDNSLIYKILTTSDLFPEIKVVQISDSIDFKVFHFKGNVIDDYGFNRLDFNLSFEGKDSIITLPVSSSLLNQDFYYSFNFESVKSLGKSFKYFFSISDNDIINHFKRSISETFSFNFPDYKEIVSKENSDLNTLEKLFDKSSRLAEDIQNKFDDLKMKQISSELTEWEKFQSVKEIMNKKNELENVLNEIAQQNKDANNFTNSFTEEKAEILKKQQEIEELLNEVFSDELKKLFDEFNELAKQFDLRKFDQLSKQMDSRMEDLSKQLDKNMQLLKKMKIEQKVERILESLKELGDAEKEISRNMEKMHDFEKLIPSEKNNFLQLKSIEQEYNQVLELNKTLQKPMNLLNFEKEFNGISSNFENVLLDLEKKNKRRANTEIESNVNDINELIFAMDQMLKNLQKKENQQNIEDLKQILDNLIFVSFDQEKVLNKLQSTDFNNPIINELKVKQRNIGNQVNFLRDSLYSLSKRTPEISSVINKEMLALENNTTSSFDYLEGGNIGASRMYQQYSITSANNLALFLSEALENIKAQQKNGGEGEDCDKPGGKSSKPGMKNLKDSQNSIKEQLQQMIDQMKKGDMGKLSKSIGQTIAQQEIMQQMIKEMLNGSKVGSQAQSQLKAIDQLLEQTRKDLINRNITSELINRQNIILSKLLEAEKSEIERDFEEKRESKTASEIKNENAKGYFEYNNAVKNENEFIKRNNFILNSFYDQKYNQFINKIKN